MPSKKKKYNARFPAGRIKKIMQSDEEIGKVAQAVPVIISKTLELFVESLLTKTMKITNSRNAKTLSTSHMKQCIITEQRFDFLRELVKNIPDISVAEEAANYNDEDAQSSPEDQYHDSDTPTDLSMPSTSLQASRAAAAAATAGTAPIISSSSSMHTTNGAGSVYQRSYSEGGGIGAHAVTRPTHPHQRAHLKRTEPAAELATNYSTRRHAAYMPTTSTSASANSVIMHTTNVLKAVDCLPAKLLRSDSTPAERPNNRATSSGHNPTITRTTTTTRRESAETAAKAPAASPIPAPIVSFDFCNKPIVKIDYSNLSALATTAPAAAASSSTLNANATELNTPANIQPVINIDLSNLCTTPTATATPFIANVLDANASRNPKATATITATTTPGINQKFELMKTATTTTATKNSFLELDEDYDNI